MAKIKAFKVRLSNTAEDSYRQLVKQANPHIERGESEHPHVKALRLVDECLDKIIPHDPFSKDRALTGAFSNVFRVKKGRVRICYIGSSKAYEIVVLYISDTLRKAGDKRDPYTIFSSLVMSGQYDQIFDALGVKRPPRKGKLQAPDLQ